MRVRLRPEAEDEIREAAQWYQGQVGGLGEKFIDEVTDALFEIERHPGRYPPPTGLRTDRNIHRIVLPRFPYSVIYEIRPEDVIVLAVAHQRRRPIYWRNRLT